MARRTDAPRVIHAPRAFRVALEEARAGGARVGFVPTMGALHAGHLALVDAARARVGDHGVVAVSIFVNPTQFGPQEDFAKYPRTLEADVTALTTAGADYVFAPAANDMYPPGDQTRVRAGALAQPLCGPFRPGHFEGVATVVTKLFGLAGPSLAVFGRKDYQQWKMLERVATDLFLPVEVLGVPTVREPDGLAMSSRNRYLSVDARAKAAAIPRALGAAVRAWNAGEHDAAAIRAHALARLSSAADRVDYVDVLDPDTLGEHRAGSGRALLAVALHLGSTRLIDNVVLGEDPAPDGDGA